MKVIEYKFFDADDDEDRVAMLPAMWDICWACEGDGKSSAYLGAITSSERERDWSAEEWEGYMRGDLDKPCEDCSATGKVLVVDIDALDEKTRERYLKSENDREKEEAYDRSVWRAENGWRDD